MKRFLRFFLCAVCVLTLPLFGGCSGCANLFDFNDRTTTEYYPLREDDNYYYYRAPSRFDFIRVNKVTGKTDFYDDPDDANGFLPGEAYEYVERETWTRQEGDREYRYVVPAAPVVVRGQDNGHWRDSWEVSEENYPLLEKILSTYEIKKVEYIHTIFARMQDGGTYGFVNAYAFTTGALSSGGSSSVTGIIYGVFVRYDFESGQFEELLRVKGGCILAFDEDTVLYHKDKAYYTQNLGAEPQYICKDYAYDDGLTSYSYAYFYFNDKHFVIFLHKGRERVERDYAYVLDTDGNIVSKCAKDIEY